MKKPEIEVLGWTKEHLAVKNITSGIHTIIERKQLKNYNVVNDNHLVFLLGDDQSSPSFPRH